MMPSKSEAYFKRTNVFFMIVLWLLTHGIYNAYWFINRKKHFKKLQGKDLIPYRWWVFMFIYLSISVLYTLVRKIFFTDFGVSVLNSFDIIFSFYYIGCLYYSVFRAKEMIEDDLGEEVFNPWLLFFFNIWYLQYKINRIENRGRGWNEAEKAIEG